MRALWSEAFSLVFYLKVNSTFQNWTIIFVHFEISENSFKFSNKLLNYLIREKRRSVGPIWSFLSNHKIEKGNIISNTKGYAAIN
jgi:hypothetical protein